MLSALLALSSAIVTLVWIRLCKSVSPALLLTGGLLYAVFLVFVLTHLR
jgi:cation:H+ antiporter